MFLVTSGRSPTQFSGFPQFLLIRDTSRRANLLSLCIGSIKAIATAIRLIAVVHQSNNRQTLFISDTDVAAYSHWLSEGASRFQVELQVPRNGRTGQILDSHDFQSRIIAGTACRALPGSWFLGEHSRFQ